MNNKFRYLFIFILAVVLFALFDSATSPSSTESASNPVQTVTPMATEAKQEATPTAKAFTVEHDDEYYTTQEYIYKFLAEKGFEVQTIVGVPNIGRFEDTDPKDNSVGWYAYIKHNGEWTEFVVMLYNGEVSSVLPNK